jgi:hypothetical protein
MEANQQFQIAVESGFTGNFAQWAKREADRTEAANVLPNLRNQIELQTRGVRATSKSEMEQQLLDDVAEMHQVAADVGIRPATVVSCWPTALHSTGPHVQHHIIPPCPIGQSYVLYTIKGYGIPDKDGVMMDDPGCLQVDNADKGGRFDPKIVLPITMARDILQQHSKSNTVIQHGVVIYMGDHAPNKENLAAINDSREKMIAHMRNQVNQAVTDWVRGGRKSIQVNDNVRLMVEYLTFHRYMTEKERPGFMVVSRNREDIPDKCKNCGTEPEKDAAQCAKCGYIVNALLAYENGTISLTNDDDTPNPVGVRTMARLSRSQLEQLGVSHLVPRTDEERKAAERGAPPKDSKKPKVVSTVP